jgi:hypothetical protein
MLMSDKVNIWAESYESQRRILYNDKRMTVLCYEDTMFIKYMCNRQQSIKIHEKIHYCGWKLQHTTQSNWEND